MFCVFACAKIIIKITLVIFLFVWALVIYEKKFFQGIISFMATTQPNNLSVCMSGDYHYQIFFLKIFFCSIPYWQTKPRSLFKKR